MVKKRGSLMAPEELQRRLLLDGGEEVIIFLTPVQGQPLDLVGKEVAGEVSRARDRH